VALAESLIESIDKDSMLTFGKYAIRSICEKDQALVQSAVNKKEFWKVVQLAHFGSVHQQALAAKEVQQLSSPQAPASSRNLVKRAEKDVTTINSILVPYQGGDVKRLAGLLRKGTPEQRVMAAQALNGLCGMGLSEKVAASLSNPATIREAVALLQKECDSPADKRGPPPQAASASAGASAGMGGSPLLKEWIQDFSLPPRISLAGLFGALGTHKPESLNRALEWDVLQPLAKMVGRGEEKERELVASLLLVMMTASEKAWRAAKASKLLSESTTTAAASAAANKRQGGGNLPLLATCLKFDGTHEELGDHMFAMSK